MNVDLAEPLLDRHELVDKDTMDDMDFLVCGSCHLEFPLSDITLFMRHKRSDCTEGRENSVGDIIEHFQCYSCPVKFATALGLVLHAQTSHQLQIYYEGLNPTQDRETQNNQRTQQDKQVCRSQPKHNNTLKEAVNSDDSYHQLSLAGGAECHNQGSPYSNADLPEQHMRSSRPHGMSLQNSPSSSTVSTPIPSGGRGQWHEVQDTPEDLSLSPHRAPSSSLSLSHGHAHHQPCLSPNDYSILTATQETWLGNHGSKDDSMQNLSNYSRVAVVPKKRKWVSEDRYTSAGSEDEVKVTRGTNRETGLEHSDEACSAQNGFVVHNPLTIQANQESSSFENGQQQHSFRRECTKALEDTIRKHLNSDSLIREQLLRRTEHSANMYKMPELIEVAKAAPTDSAHLLSTGVSMDLQAPKLEMEAGVPMASEDLWDCESRSSLQLNKKRRYPTTRPFKCDQCDHSFNQRIHLKKHLSKHTGIKPFKCNQCDYATVERSHLKVHIRIHTGEKPFKCLYCDYATAQNSTLKIHLKRHHAGTIITCETCGRNFTDKSDYELHALEHQQNGTPQKGLKPPGGENQHLPVVPSPHENSYPAGRVVVAES